MIEKVESDSSYSLVYSGYYKERKGKPAKKVGDLFIENELLKARLENRQGWHLCAFLIKKSLIDQYSIFFTSGCRYGEDTEFLLKLLCHSEAGAVPEFLFHYCLREESVMNTNWSMGRIDSLKAFQRAQGYICEHYYISDIGQVLNASRKNME